MKIIEPNIGQKEIDYVTKALVETQVGGRSLIVKEFESKFAEYVGVKYTVACNSGTSALFLAIKALKLTGEVIIPDFAFIAVANAVKMAGLEPVLVDSSDVSVNLDPREVGEAITPRTSASIAVDTYGEPCSNDLAQIADDNDLVLIEDLAEAVGKKGIIGKVACYSFFANKTMTTGEGGMVVTNDEAVYKELLRLTERASKKSFTYPYMAYSFRLSAIQAALGLAQLERLDSFKERKQLNAALYFEGLSDILDFIKTGEQWIAAGLACNEEERDAILAELERNGIEGRRFFPPIHTQKVYLQKDEFPNATDYWKRGICLPSGTTLKVEDINTVIKIITQWKSSQTSK